MMMIKLIIYEEFIVSGVSNKMIIFDYLWKMQKHSNGGRNTRSRADETSLK